MDNVVRRLFERFSDKVEVARRAKMDVNIVVQEILRNVKPGNYAVGDKLYIVTGPAERGQSGKVEIQQVCQL